MDYDLEMCQINGTNMIITREGSGGYVYFQFTYPHDIEEAISQLASAETYDQKMDIVEAIYSINTFTSGHDEGGYLIGQYDFDSAIEVMAFSHPVMTTAVSHGSELIQINAYGRIEEENSQWVHLFMGFIAQFSVWWSYVGMIFYGLGIILYKVAISVKRHTKKS